MTTDLFCDEFQGAGTLCLYCHRSPSDHDPAVPVGRNLADMRPTDLAVDVGTHVVDPEFPHVDAVIADPDPEPGSDAELLEALRDALQYHDTGPCVFVRHSATDARCQIHGELPPLRITDSEIMCAVRRAQLVAAARSTTPAAEAEPDELDRHTLNRYLIGSRGGKVVSVNPGPLAIDLTTGLDPLDAMSLAAWLATIAEVVEHLFASRTGPAVTFDDVLARIRNT